MTIAAIYARKSTDDSDRNEEARSTTRQVQRATAYAQSKGWTVDARYILADESGEIMTVVHSLAASFERRRARQRTYDALRRRAEAGAVTGGRVFGYLNHRNGDGYVHRAIHEPEADVVRRIFTMYAEGAGLTRIAKRLNAERVPAPRGGTGSWAGTAVREIIRRPLYAGVLTWNRTQKVTRKGTKAQRKRAASEWMERPAPELAIVDAKLWQRVQARREAAGATFLRRMNGRLIGRPSGADVESPYLLSGIAECALCGGLACGHDPFPRAPADALLRLPAIPQARP
jgi:DNA invertase Pin-like site-specific DNA recombinase